MSISQDLQDATVRVDQIIWIPGAVSNLDALPDQFAEDFLDDMPVSESDILYTQLPMLRRFALVEDQLDAEYVAELLMFTPGFLVEARTPVMEHHTSGASYTWGIISTAWLYAPDEASIPRVVIAWAESRRAKERAIALRGDRDAIPLAA
ncbi:MAG: hypothetical protein ACAH27_05915 [Xanthobacteraceae bacterium]